MRDRDSLFKYALTLFFLTMVLSHQSVVAKPHDEVPGKKEDLREKDDYLDLEKQDVNVAPEPNVFIPKKLGYPYTQSISFRAGVSFDLNESTGNQKSHTVFSGLYMFKKFTSPQLEVGADMANDNTGFFHGGIRHIYRIRQFCRPFCKYGLGINFEAPKNLSSLVDFKNNYYLLISSGLELSLWRSTSLRLELQSFAGASNTYGSGYLSLSWAW